MKWVNGRYLLSIRRSLGMTQAGLADRLGVAQATVSRWESGLHEPTGEQWKAILALAKPSEHAADWSLMFMVRTARSPLILTTLDFDVLEVSEPALAADGISRQDFLARNLRPLFSDGLSAALLMAEDSGLFTGQAVGMQIAGVMRRLDGSQAPHASTWVPLRRADGTPLLLWQREYIDEGTLADISHQEGARVVTLDDIFGATPLNESA